MKNVKPFCSDYVIKGSESSLLGNILFQDSQTDYKFKIISIFP